MCESTLYTETNGVKKKIADDIMLIEVEGCSITASDMLGKTFNIRGSLKRIDLSNHEVVVVEEE